MEKTNPVVVADAGPIIHLDELECLDILADFGKVAVPEAVWPEVQWHRPQAMKTATGLFIRRSVLTFPQIVKALTPLYTLHAGEQEALHLCMELGLFGFLAPRIFSRYTLLSLSNRAFDFVLTYT